MPTRGARKIKLASLFLAAATAGGCVQPSPWGATAAGNPSAPGMSALPGAPSQFAASPGPNAPGSPLGVQAADRAMASQQPAQPSFSTMAPSAFGGGAAMATLKSAKDSLVSAAQLKPQVIPAVDPVKLDNQP